MSLLLESTIKVSLILLVALGLMPLLRHRSAALRHWVLSASLFCAAMAPLAQLVVPQWHLPPRLASVVLSAPARSLPALASSSAPRDATEDRDVSGFAASATTHGRLPSLAALVRWIWIAGAGLSGAVLLIGLWRLTLLAATARPLVGGMWVDRAEEICREYACRRPVTLLQSNHRTLLVTCGLRRPKIILPAAARDWSEDRARLVLYHELAHVRRGDWIVQLLGEFLRTIYWFNPLVWKACSRLREESEQACDDDVINRGVDGSSYAAHLVDIARSLQQRRVWTPAPAIARSSTLEKRVKAMLNTHLNRRPVSRSASAATLAALLTVTVPIAGFAAAQTVFATLTGSIVDPTNAAVPGVTLVLTNAQTQAKYEISSGGAGQYEFVGLPPGEYMLEARLPGFAALQGKVTLAGQKVQRDLRLALGSLTETVTVKNNGVRSTTPPVVEVREPRPVRCGESEAAGGLRVGGNVRPPMKIKHVSPVYPSNLADAGVGGAVALEVRIGTSGVVDDVNVVSSSHPELAEAAVAAVRQWQFDATLLNCVPVEVAMDVRVNFVRE
jgi:TonB family protein